jgi:hypothetical protein
VAWMSPRLSHAGDMHWTVLCHLIGYILLYNRLYHNHHIRIGDPLPEHVELLGISRILKHRPTHALLPTRAYFVY